MTQSIPTPPPRPLSQLIEEVRKDLANARSKTQAMTRLYPGWKERVDHVAGLLTCGIVTLHSSLEEVVEHEIKADDAKHGPHLRFRPRGLGLDQCPGCFVCGALRRSPEANGYLNNIAAFVNSKEAGEQAVNWFHGRARLDYRPSEPKWIQVKVGACDLHMANLKHLYNAAAEYGLIRQSQIAAARDL